VARPVRVPRLCCWSGGGFVTQTRELTGECLLGWLAAVRSSLRPSTWESSERLVRGHLIPRVGHDMTTWTPAQLTAFLGWVRGDRSGLPRIRFHDLRAETVAALMFGGCRPWRGMLLRWPTG